MKVYNSAGSISAGDSVQFDESGEVVVGASGAEILGIALEDATSSTTISVDIAHPGDEFDFPIEAGTVSAATVGTEIDLNSADGVAASTSTNDDVMVTEWDGVSTTSGFIRGCFRKLAKGATIV